MHMIRTVPSLGRRRLFSIALASLLVVAAPAALAQEEGGETVDGLRLTEITLARNIEAGQAIDPTSTFSSADGRVWVLLRVENTTGAEADIRVSFERADREPSASASGGVVLHLPARPRYRTQARTGTRGPGRYRVVVRTSAGNVLGTADYEVTQ